MCKPLPHRSKNELVKRINVQQPLLLDPGRLSLPQLPGHILLLIFDFVKDDSLDEVRTVAAVSTTCGALREVARYVQFRVVHIDMDQCRHLRSRLEFLSRNLMLCDVHVFEVNGRPQFQLQAEEEWNEIVRLLGDIMLGMTRLSDLHWHVGSKMVTPSWNPNQATVPIPLSMLENLPARTRLHTSVLCEETHELHDQAREFLARLVHNRNLVSLSVKVFFMEDQECRETMRILKRVLISCPNLTRLPSLYVGFPSGPQHHGIWDGPIAGVPYCGLGFAGGERPPALEEFGVDRYPWGREPDNSLIWNGLYSTGYPEKGTEVDYWATTFDWSRLVKLHDLHPVLALEIAPKLTSLKEVIFEDYLEYIWDKTTALFLETIPAGLEVLSIPAWSQIGSRPAPITRNGADLRILKIHGPDWRSDNLVTDEDLFSLCENLPYLEELDLDIARDRRNNDWPWSTLNIVAKFSRLRVVRLWFDLSGDGDAPLQTPYLTLSAAHQLFDYLQERNENIQRLELRSRARLIRYVYGHRLPCREAENSIDFVCQRSTRGDVAENSLTVMCQELSKDMNDQLDRLVKEPGQDWRALPDNTVSLAVRIALEGPLSVEDWGAWHNLQTRRREEAYRRERSKVWRLRRYISRALPWMKK
jgi:hypothetical protein